MKGPRLTSGHQKLSGSTRNFKQAQAPAELRRRKYRMATTTAWRTRQAKRRLRIAANRKLAESVSGTALRAFLQAKGLLHEGCDKARIVAGYEYSELQGFSARFTTGDRMSYGSETEK